MNILEVQNRLKNFSQEQLVQEMQRPSGQAPQFLVLSELQRRKQMQADFAKQQSQQDQTTVAQDAVAAAGVPQGGIAQMARSMAPKTNTTQNTGIASVAPQGMKSGGAVRKMQIGGPPMSAAESAATRARNASSYIGAPKTITYGGVDFILYPSGMITNTATNSVVSDPELIKAVNTMAGRGGDMSIPMTAVAPTGNELPSYVEPPGVWSAIVGDMPGAANADALLEKGTITPQAYEQLVQGSRRQQAAVLTDVATAKGDAPVGAVPYVFPAADTAAPPAPTPPASAGLPSIAATSASLTGAAPAAPIAATSASLTGPAPAPAPTSTTPSGGGMGGGAGVPGAGAPSDYESELMSMLKSNERKAEQDKWLTLAQFGLQLMAANSPSLAGSIGQAGQNVIPAYQESRDANEAERMKLLGALEESRMARKAMAMRAASAGGSAGPKPMPATIIAGLQRQLSDAQTAMASLPPPVAGEQDPYAAQRMMLQTQITQLQAQIGMGMSQYGVAPLGAPTAFDFDATQPG